MKRIIIATDFSAASQTAIEYGIAFAAALDSSVTVVNAYREITTPVTVDLLLPMAKDVQNYSQEQLRLQLARVHKEKTAPVQLLAAEGSPVDVLLQTAHDLQADMIVAGMKGEGKNSRRIFGSTVTALSRKTPIPLLIVPENSVYAVPRNIVFANDLDPGADVRLLAPLREIALNFNSKVHILRVIKKKEDEVIEIMEHRSRLEKMLRSLDVRFEFLLDKHVPESITRFAGSHDISMVAMVPHPHFIPEKWFVKSVTREMFFETRVPVLIIPEPGRPD